jgi:transcriptional regulator GlxA family with amidase domain
MKRVCFLMPQGLLKLSSLFGAIEIFEIANAFYILNGQKPYYDIKVIGSDIRQSMLNTQCKIKAEDPAKCKDKPDIIVIPGMHNGNDYSLGKNKRLLGWMIDRYKDGCELASLCTGAFMLAASGLLDNKECSTHWAAEQAFNKKFPRVKLRTHKIITDSNGIYTTGGATSSLNLILHLIEKYSGHDAAIYCSKILQLDIDRRSQLPFMMFRGQHDHEDEAVKAAQEFIETNIAKRVTIEFLARKFGMSNRNFIRRFKKATNEVPIGYIQKVRIEAAKRSLERKRKNINEVMYAVGYNDVKTFRTIFKKITGFSPIEYQQKFGKH